MNPMHIRKVHHIAIICSDYAASKHFYTAILGCSIIAETWREQRQSFKLDLKVHDHCQIELFSFPSPPQRPTQPEACGLRHLAFSVDDIEASISWLRQHKVPCEPIRIDEQNGKRFVFFFDPDGLPLELYEEP